MTADLTTLKVSDLYAAGSRALTTMQAEIPVLEGAFPTSGQTVDEFKSARSTINGQIDALNNSNTKLVRFISNSGYVQLSGTINVGDVLSITFGANPPCSYTTVTGDSLFSAAQGLMAAVNVANYGPVAQTVGALIMFISPVAYTATGSTATTLTIIEEMTGASTIQNIEDYVEALITQVQSYITPLVVEGAPDGILNDLQGIVSFLTEGLQEISDFILAMNL